MLTHFLPRLLFLATAAAFTEMTVPGHGLAAESGSHHFLHPTPHGQMREMATDRPDTTESPFTVDAGHWQIEMSIFDFSRDAGDGGSAEAWAFGQINLKAGLLPHTDLQVMLDSHTRETIRSGGTRHTTEGFGDISIRLKQNLWGNDGGRTAFSLMPYLKIPTGTALSNGRWEGGLILPFAVSLSERISLGTMVQADIRHDRAGDRHVLDWIHSATLGFALTERLGMYVEAAAVAGTATDYAASFNSGFTFAATENWCLDTGIRLGLNRAAEDLGIFTGMSIRF